MRDQLKRILPRVRKPGRYCGGEYGAAAKPMESVDFRAAFMFPDTYEIGMSHLGMRILYGLMNNMEGVFCERVFAPWTDMEEEMRAAGMPLYGLESGDAVRGFDLLAFTLQYELSYTNILNMLDLAGLPLRSSERDGSMPLVIGGGPGAFNPEPLAPFIDLFFVGEGEDFIVEFINLAREAKRAGFLRKETLLRAAEIPGVYVPSLYEALYNEDGTLASFTPAPGAPKLITKRIVKDLDSAYFPENPIVPTTEIVHDRIMLELFRGCIRGCRFCQAGFSTLPIREKTPETLVRQGINSLTASGYQEISLTSLSTSDYPGLHTLCDGLLDYCNPRNISLSLPSLRVDNFSTELMEKVQSVRKSGLTFAPEAGSQRLRDAVNKNVTEEDLLKTCGIAFSGGWNSVKLYFMLGLPTETDEDVVAIAELARKVHAVWRENSQNRQRGVRITVSTACFVPKPLTPFQWEAQITHQEYERRTKLLRDAMKTRSVTYNWHSGETGLVEAAFARGDRCLSDVLESAWRLGCRLDGWGEYFSYSKWMEAFDKCGVDPAFYASRERKRDELLPWAHISAGVHPEYLWKERERCYASKITPDCGKACTGCGADSLLEGGCRRG